MNTNIILTGFNKDTNQPEGVLLSDILKEGQPKVYMAILRWTPDVATPDVRAEIENTIGQEAGEISWTRDENTPDVFYCNSPNLFNPNNTFAMVNQWSSEDGSVVGSTAYKVVEKSQIKFMPGMGADAIVDTLIRIEKY